MLSKKKILLFLLVCLYIFSSAQETPISFRNEGIYDFLDELANIHIITINSAVKPYSNGFIYTCLANAEKQNEKLNPRQQKELTFYLRQYSILSADAKNPYTNSKRGNLITRSPKLNLGILPPGLHYKDSLFTFSIKPIWGIREYSVGGKSIRHTWGGAEAWGCIKNFTVYASLRDNSQTEILANPTYFTQQEGGNYKTAPTNKTGGDYSEMRGGVVYGWKWGSIGLVKDQVQWGTNYHGSNIFSGRTPSFGMIKLQMKPVRWFELNYFHGWLISEVVDSTRSYTTSNGDYRAVYRDKYIAANLMTFTPLKDISFSVGNSIVYSDMNVQPVYLIPVMFYKSIDHTLNHNIDNQNSQMFFDLSIRRIKNLHLYSSFFIDDFSVIRVGNSKRHNFISQKYGSRLSNWPIRNMAITLEYTKTNPVVYKHRVEATTFETNKFNLGHYLRDNSDEIYGVVEVRPFRGFLLRGEVTYARHGNEYAYTNGNEAELLPFMKNVTWQNLTVSFTSRWEFIHDSWLYLNVAQSDIKGYNIDGHTAQEYLDLYTPKSFQGKNTIITAGLNFGF